jgi:hypothetical protein
MEAEKKEQRGIQNFHLDVRRWCDYAYHYGIGPSGRIYEGRGFEVFGAHSPGRNHEPAVVLQGTYSSQFPTDAQHRAVYALMEHIDAGDLRGHRENSPTTCPGDAAMAKVVNGPPPDDVGVPVRRARFYFEELPFGATAGHGPVIVGQAIGYSMKTVRDAKLAAFKALHPLTTTSTMRGLLGRDREVIQDHGEELGARYFILTWGPNMHGQRHRFGPWRDEADRTRTALKRASNRLGEPAPSDEAAQAVFLGRAGLRRFNGRQRSLYPWPI